MRFIKKIALLLIIAAIIGPIFYFINGMFGNPVSKAIAKHNATDYIAEHYEGKNLRIDHVVYNFKINAYSAHVVSDSSIDTHFSVYISKLGKVLGDSYEDVESGWNTYCRLEDTYRNIVDSVIERHKLNENSDINFGTIKINEKEDYDKNNIDFGIELSSLELDKQYDMNELAKNAGYIVYYALSEDVSLEKACEILMRIKQVFDDENVPFYAIDFVLQKSNGSEKPAADGDSIRVKEFLYTDLYSTGLEERVQTAHEQLSAYYAEKDAEREAALIEENN